MIARILTRSQAQPSIEQEDIQRLIWGIEAQAKFADFEADFQERVRPLLTSDEIRSLNATRLDRAEIGRQILGRLLPQNAKDVIDRYTELRARVTDATVSYEELRDIAVTSGVAPRGRGSRDVLPGVGLCRRRNIHSPFPGRLLAHDGRDRSTGALSDRRRYARENRATEGRRRKHACDVRPRQRRARKAARRFRRTRLAFRNGEDRRAEARSASDGRTSRLDARFARRALCAQGRVPAQPPGLRRRCGARL